MIHGGGVGTGPRPSTYTKWKGPRNWKPPRSSCWKPPQKRPQTRDFWSHPGPQQLKREPFCGAFGKRSWKHVRACCGCFFPLAGICDHKRLYPNGRPFSSASPGCAYILECQTCSRKFRQPPSSGPLRKSAVVPTTNIKTRDCTPSSIPNRIEMDHGLTETQSTPSIKSYAAKTSKKYLGNAHDGNSHKSSLAPSIPRIAPLIFLNCTSCSQWDNHPRALILVRAPA